MVKNPNKRRHELFDTYNDGCSTSYGFNLGYFFSGEDHHPIIDAKGEILSLIPKAFRRHMYLHQLNGFQFLWKNIGGATLIEDIKTPLPEGGFGYIISHAPGTGKTYMTIFFLLISMKDMYIQGNPPTEIRERNVNSKIFSQVLIRDDIEDVLASMAYVVRGMVEAAHAALEAIWRGLMLAQELFISNFILESDCAPTFRRIKENKEDLSYLGHLVNGRQQIIITNPNIDTEYISRRINIPANLLAQYACNISEYLVWMEEVPKSVDSTIFTDKSST
ncbi:hypothetical protein M9H77_09382 [Catharanthus roseus]|uniref:Uncharacterized protein n=1 Tax=Catharanthus roseus TaxID=4058 RepID=A0ACC0C0S0_CATRO|nr:hypothetical protein M9H77_09382 [Catharanthus roseus]